MIEGYVDIVCSTVNESVKTVLHEVYSLSAQLVNGASVVALGFVHKPGLQSHLEHRKRIKKRVAPGGRRQSIFSELAVDEDDSENAKLNNIAEEGENPVSEKERIKDILLRAPDSPKSLHSKSPRGRINPRKKNNQGLVHSNSSSSIQLNDLAHYHEHMTTGLLEDLFTNTMVFIDRIFMRIRLLCRSILGAFSFSFLTSFPLLLISVLNPFNWIRRIFGIFQKVKKVPEKMVQSDQLDVRCVKDIIEQAGYPYEQHKVVTEDGYILLLERIPNRASKHVLYLQHGIFDSAFAWVANGTAALAYRSHDKGYDVFLGNFRGNGTREHVRKNMTEAEYWDFSINEHAFKDYPAFINHINKLKHQEFASPIKPHPPLLKTVPVPLTETALSHLSSSVSSMSIHKDDKKGLKDRAEKDRKGSKEGSERDKRGSKEGINNNKGIRDGHMRSEDLNADSPFQLNVVSHSMGAAATLMYIVQCRMQNTPHQISQAILLSPAGYHKSVPWLCDIMGPLINAWLYFVPSFHVFRFPSDSARVWTAKAFHDLMNSGALATLSAYMFSRFLFGGAIQDHPVTKVHNLAYNTFTGTSVRTYRHFWQLYKSGKFQAYNYGEARNREVYGSPFPTDFLENYDLIDIPIHFCIGLRDNLICPSNVKHQYDVLHKFNPELAFLKASQNGHLEFTLGLDEPLVQYIMEALNSLEKKQ